MLQPGPSPTRFNDRAAFRAWVAQQPRGRWERHDGLVVAMAPERINHVRIKYRIWRVLADAISTSGLPCEAFGDGITVEVGEDKDYEPDAVVSCGEQFMGDEVAVRNPLIVVEVTSRSTAHVDAGEKLDGYFSLPSVQHYLLVSMKARRIMHYSRLEPGRLLARICKHGFIDLDPPGLGIDVAAVYEGTDLA